MITEIIITFFVFLMYFKLLLDFKKNKISIKRFFFWIFIWLSLSIIVLFPGIVFFFSNLFGIERAKDLPIYISIIVLFILIFRVGMNLEKIEQEITKIVKGIALKENEK